MIPKRHLYFHTNYYVTWKSEYTKYGGYKLQQVDFCPSIIASDCVYNIEDITKAINDMEIVLIEVTYGHISYISYITKYSVSINTTQFTIHHHALQLH